MLIEESQSLDIHIKRQRIQSVLAELDNSQLTGFHWKAMVTSGMGFFTDAYDLFIIGAALAILTPLWNLNALQISLVGSTSLLAAALGSYIFGRLADRIGRHAIYGLTLVVLAIGAILTSLAPNIYWLLIFRFIMGLGIGGDYPLSATLMSEYANRKDRGKLITMVFSMQGLGLILGPLVAILLMISGIQSDWTWRIMLGLGAVPALATFYLRRQIKETPRFALMVQGNVEGARQTVKSVTSANPILNGHNGSTPATKKSRTSQKSWLYLLRTPRYLSWMIGTAGAWFLLDIAYYGTTISSPLVLQSLNPHSHPVTDMFYTLLIFLVAALPGYIIAALTIDRLGRKTIQCFGFAMMALAYGLLAVIPGLTQVTVPFLVVYALSYFFTEFGPNVTTFVYPAEIFPVMVRSTAHGIAAALGKFGAFIGAFIFPYLLGTWGLPSAMAVSAIVSLGGLILTAVTLPEPNQRSLEEISGTHAVMEAEPVGA
ncbi:MAG TPA: MFS transporter [Ktedonosporobacter sp.]|nr:MFS transporter [Ktedonosporobacter sp.]